MLNRIERTSAAFANPLIIMLQNAPKKVEKLTEYGGAAV